MSPLVRLGNLSNLYVRVAVKSSKAGCETSLVPECRIMESGAKRISANQFEPR